PDWSFLKQALERQAEKLPVTASIGVSCIIPDEDIPPFSDLSEARSLFTSELWRQCAEHVILGGGNPNGPAAGSHLNLILRPEMIRLMPPLLPCPQAAEATSAFTARASPEDETSSSKDGHLDEEQAPSWPPDSLWDEELIWLTPNVVIHDFHWDESIGCAHPSAELIQLISLAMTSVLSQSQQQTVVQAIKNDSTPVQELGITPENVSSTVSLCYVTLVYFAYHKLYSFLFF
ncbi:unnamed protein product, partial [Protopolystoma xenopodis]